MPDDQELAANVRAALAGTGNIREVTMFGGIGFMLNGNLVAAASRRGLLLRVGKDRQAEALAQSGARPMVMRGPSDPVIRFLKLAPARVLRLPRKCARRRFRALADALPREAKFVPPVLRVGVAKNSHDLPPY
jgi:TfoX/Sxy family transcriptional regulator of competence genes